MTTPDLPLTTKDPTFCRFAISVYRDVTRTARRMGDMDEAFMFVADYIDTPREFVVDMYTTGAFLVLEPRWRGLAL